MYIYRNFPANLIWRFGWINFSIFIVWGTLVFYVHELFEHIILPFPLISTVGVAVAIYLSFKNSQSYDRQWEARKIWGELARASKILSQQVHAYVPRQDTDHHQSVLKDIVYRQLAFLNSTRLQLRKPASHSRKYISTLKIYFYGRPTQQQWDEEVGTFLNRDEYINLKTRPNMAFQILCSQYEAIYQLRTKDHIGEFHQMDLNKTIDSCIESLGKCERIKGTPFPRQYAFFSKTFTWIFVVMLPLGLIGELDGAGIANFCAFLLLNTLISWIFITMELVGDFSEDPFENFASDVPMSAICRNVEIELKSFLGEPVPEKIEPIDGYLL